MSVRELPAMRRAEERINIGSIRAITMAVFAIFMLSAGITLRSNTSSTTGRQTLDRQRSLGPRTLRRARSRSSSRSQTNGSRFLTTGP